MPFWADLLLGFVIDFVLPSPKPVVSTQQDVQLIGEKQIRRAMMRLAVYGLAVIVIGSLYVGIISHHIIE